MSDVETEPASVVMSNLETECTSVAESTCGAGVKF